MLCARHGAKSFKGLHSFSPLSDTQMGAVMTPILQVRKLGTRRGEVMHQRSRTATRLALGLNSDLSEQSPHCLPTGPGKSWSLFSRFFWGWAPRQAPSLGERPSRRGCSPSLSSPAPLLWTTHTQGRDCQLRKGSQFTFFSFLMKCQRLVSEGKCQNNRQKEKNIPFLFSGQTKQGS